MEARTKGIARVIYIFNIMQPSLVATLPDALTEFAQQILDSAIEKAESFARTGGLRESLTMEVIKDQLIARIGPTISYGPFVSFPTRAHFIGSPVQVAPGVWRFIGTHPGTGGNPYLEWSLLDVAPHLPEILQPLVMSKFIEIDRESKGFEFAE